MEIVTIWLFDTDAGRLFAKDIAFSDITIRNLLCVDTEDVYSYAIPLKERRGTFYILFCPAHCRAENTLLYSFLYHTEISWSERIYGNAILLYTKNSPTEYASLPFSDASDGVPYVKAHKNTCELPRVAVRSHFTKVATPTVTYQGVSQTVPMAMCRSDPGVETASTAPASPATANRNSFLLKMALRGLIAEGATCPISLEPLSESTTVWMFPCGHACSPQSVQLNQCPTCRHKQSYTIISL